MHYLHSYSKPSSEVPLSPYSRTYIFAVTSILFCCLIDCHTYRCVNVFVLIMFVYIERVLIIYAHVESVCLGLHLAVLTQLCFGGFC